MSVPDLFRGIVFSLRLGIVEPSVLFSCRIGQGFLLERLAGKVNVGPGLSARRFCTFVVNNGVLSIGKKVFFNQLCSVNCLSEIHIGDNTIFGEGVKIYDHNHRYDTGGLIRDSGFVFKDVDIGNNCWIGSNVCILAGAKIGDGCVIGAGSIVRGEVPAGTLYFSDGSSRQKRREDE